MAKHRGRIDAEGAAETAAGGGGRRSRNWPAIMICGGMLMIFALLSYSAAITKCPTYDETLHAPAAWMDLYQGDFRVNPEHPNLWKFWAAIPQGPRALNLQPSAAALAKVNAASLDAAWRWAEDALYHTPPEDGRAANDGDAFVQRSRGMMTMLGVMLGALIAAWAWRLRGAAAAVAGTALFTFDPNFLAHASLVTNDVASALATAAVVYFTWRCGQKASLARLGLLAVCLMAAINIKFSGLILGPVMGVLLIWRAMMRQPWEWLGRALTTRGKRLGAVIGYGAICAGLCYGAIWACYDFRFNPSPTDPSARINTEYFTRLAIIGRLLGQHPTYMPTQAEIDRTLPPEAVVLLRGLEKRRLFPQAWIGGLMFNVAMAETRTGFLCGRISDSGWWYYFPLAIAFKSTVATLAMLAITLVMGVMPAAGAAVAGMKRRGGDGEMQGNRFCVKTAGKPPPQPSPGVPGEGEQRQRQSPGGVMAGVPAKRAGEALAREALAREASGNGTWAVICLALPAVFYGVALLLSTLNIGVRHALPLFPFLYVAAGCAAARLWQMGTAWRVLLGVLAGGLVVESVLAFPNYLAFFNVACGGSRGGIRLLGDSNLDWGQDLKLLAAWQQDHPNQRLYLDYFGTADPAFYGIRYVRYHVGQPVPLGANVVVAVSATKLEQAAALSGHGEKVLEALRPAEVLGGSIYLFSRGR